eukprot:Sspe_Gene.50825::Locus_28251_Transcript_1_1_Confidence_1.000_Length_1214::g.50825::m.50825
MAMPATYEEVHVVPNNMLFTASLTYSSGEDCEATGIHRPNFPQLHVATDATERHASVSTTPSVTPFSTTPPSAFFHGPRGSVTYETCSSASSAFSPAHSYHDSSSSMQSSLHSEPKSDSPREDITVSAAEKKKRARNRRRGQGDEEEVPEGPAAVVVRVQFKWGRQGEFFHTTHLPAGAHVVVQADRGRDLGMVVESFDAHEAHSARRPTFHVLREAKTKEITKWRSHQAKDGKKAAEKAQAVLAEHGLKMHVVHAEYQFDMKKLTFHFTSPTNHPDFRPVLDTLFSLFRCRIWFARYGFVERDERNRSILASTPATPRGYSTTFPSACSSSSA